MLSIYIGIPKVTGERTRGWMIVLGGLVFARRFYVLPALSALLGGVVLFVAADRRVRLF